MTPRTAAVTDVGNGIQNKTPLLRQQVQPKLCIRFQGADAERHAQGFQFSGKPMVSRMFQENRLTSLVIIRRNCPFGHH